MFTFFVRVWMALSFLVDVGLVFLDGPNSWEQAVLGTGFAMAVVAPFRC